MCICIEAHAERKRVASERDDACPQRVSNAGSAGLSQGHTRAVRSPEQMRCNVIDNQASNQATSRGLFEPLRSHEERDDDITCTWHMDMAQANAHGHGHGHVHVHVFEPLRSHEERDDDLIVHSHRDNLRDELKGLGARSAAQMPLVEAQIATHLPERSRGWGDPRV